MKIIFYSDANKAHFHTNGSALSLVLKPRFLFNMLAITAEIAEMICPMLGNPRQSSILDSGFQTVDSRCQLLDSNLCQWKLNSGSHNLRDSGFLDLYSAFQNPGFRVPQANFLRFWIPWSVFRIAKPRIPGSTSKFSQILDSTSENFLHSGIRFPYMRRKDFSSSIMFWRSDEWSNQ